MTGRRATQTDVAVGQRIREFRKDAGLSQTELADQIGVTYQQLQKYENGINRVGSGRLLQIACALGVPITDLFGGLSRPTNKQGQALTARLAELSRLPAAPKLLAAFSKISDDVLENHIINLTRALSGSRRRH